MKKYKENITYRVSGEKGKDSELDIFVVIQELKNIENLYKQFKSENSMFENCEIKIDFKEGSAELKTIFEAEIRKEHLDSDETITEQAVKQAFVTYFADFKKASKKINEEKYISGQYSETISNNIVTLEENGKVVWSGKTTALEIWNKSSQNNLKSDLKKINDNFTDESISFKSFYDGRELTVEKTIYDSKLEEKEMIIENSEKDKKKVITKRAFENEKFEMIDLDANEEQKVTILYYGKKNSNKPSEKTIDNIKIDIETKTDIDKAYVIASGYYRVVNGHVEDIIIEEVTEAKARTKLKNKKEFFDDAK